MDKKIRFSEQPLTSKIIYGVVIAILIVSAVVVGIVAANNRDEEAPAPNDGSTTNEGTSNEGEGNQNDGTTDDTVPPEPEKKPQTFTSPVVGTIIAEHSLSIPVFSETLGEWRVHTGIDIECEEGATVYASCDGTVSEIYTDPMYGVTVEITHENDIVTVYSNLDETLAEGISVGSLVSAGDTIGTVGDSAIAELAKEAHLHFELEAKGVSVNPLDYISEESKSASLGINMA